MRRISVVVAILAVLGAGAGWYVFVQIPANVKADIDRAIDRVRPKAEVTYENLDIDIFSRKASFTNVRISPLDQDNFSMLVQTLEVTDRDGKFDFFARNLETIGEEDGYDLTAKLIKVDSVSGGRLEEGDKTGLSRIKTLIFDKGEIRGIATKNNALAVARISFGNLTRGVLKSAEMGDAKFTEKNTVAEVRKLSLTDIDLLQLTSMEKTFRGFIDWTQLNAGPSSIEAVSVKSEDVSFGFQEFRIDAIKSGRMARLLLSNMTLSGETEKKEKFDVALDKLELLDFPIITDFPTSLPELRSFQMRHKNLLYLGMEFKGFDAKIEGVNFTIGDFTIPPVTFGKTENGIRYPKKAVGNLSMSLGTEIFRLSGKQIPPFVEKIIDRPTISLNMKSTTVMDHAHRFAAIRKTTIEIPDFLSLKMSARVNDLPLRYFEAPNDPLVQQIALERATINDMELTLVNLGLAEMLVDAISETQGITPDQLKRGLVPQLRNFAQKDGTQEGLQFARQLYAFILKPQSLTLSLRPTRKVKVASLLTPEFQQSSIGSVSRILGLKLVANDPKK